jgi:uncharacterized Zn finger protein
MVRRGEVRRGLVRSGTVWQRLAGVDTGTFSVRIDIRFVSHRASV